VTDLATLNQHIHDALEDQLLAFYEALTALELADARARWSAWKDAFRNHLEAEEAELMARLPALVEQHLPGNASLAKQVDGDHTILERTIAKIDHALAQQPDGDRRALVTELDTYLLLRRVLEHHTLRECQHAYPLLEAHLDADTRAGVQERLREAAVGLLPQG
jgi:hypothetical protein